MLKIPYGISNFESLITEGYVYVDKTAYIRTLEELGKFVFFVRPRRFGKSLFVSMLDAYYDLARAERFDDLFGRLAIGREPTALRSGYLVLRLNFSAVDTSRDPEGIRESFGERVQGSVQDFLDRYRHLFGEMTLTTDLSPEKALKLGLRHATLADRRVIVLIDEYDNFANDILARGDSDTYRGMIHATGFVRSFYKALKEGTESVIDRLFVTGVSPVMLDDLTSGFNIARNVTLDEQVHEAFGFTEAELRGVLDRLELTDGRDDLVREISSLYNGYRFCETGEHLLFNADMVLHYLLSIRERGKPPRETVDHNVRTDYGRLRALALSGAGNLQTINTILAEEHLQQELIPQFGFERMYDAEYFASLLFYLGLLTIEGRQQGLLSLRIPNYAIKTVYWDYFRRLLADRHEVPMRTDEVAEAVRALGWDGEAAPFAHYVAQQVLAKLSRRDFRQFGEKHIKAIIFSLLGLTDFYVCHSETEVEHGFVDLFLIRDPRLPDLPYEWLIELKYLRESERDRLDEVRDQALGQLRRYAESREIGARFRGATLKMAALVFVGKGDIEVVVP